MTRKGFSVKKHVTSIALAMLFCLTMALPSLAAPGAAVKTSEAAITKVLEVPIGTDYPEMEFEFHISQVTEDEKAPTANMPRVGEEIDPNSKTGKVTIKYDGAKGTPPIAETLIGTEGDTTSYYLESGNIFNGVTWPHAGVYEYKIVEIDETNEAKDSNPKEEYTYSKAEYTVLVYVENEGGVYKITHIGVLMTKDDEGEEIDEEDQVKLDPTPGGGKNGDEEWDYSQMIFTNVYAKTNDGDKPEEPEDWTLAISKKVAGDLSDPLIYFDFNLMINVPSLLEGNEDYEEFKAYIVEFTPDNSPGANPGAGTYAVINPNPNNYSGAVGADDSILFTTGLAEDFKLKHNQFLVFLDTPVGTNYLVHEDGTTGYTPKATVIYAGEILQYLPGRPAPEVGTKGEGLTLHHGDNTVYKTTLYVGEGANSADFINDRGTNVPTGINSENLPYIVMLGLMLMGLAGFVVYRLRRAKRYGM